jgi:hypothetical protein
MPIAWLDIVTEHFGEGHVASRTISRLGERLIAIAAMAALFAALTVATRKKFVGKYHSE